MIENEFTNSAAADEGHMAKLLMLTDRWMATLAHELRNPLAAIMMSLEELRPICATDGAAHHARETAMDGAQYLARVVDDALDLCRAHRDKLEFRTESVDLIEVVAAGVRNSEPVISRKKHRVTFDVPLCPVAVQAHPTRIVQIVTNLVSNSANYTKPGGLISITIETAANVVTLRIRDNGIGLSRDSVSKIFEPYWKGPASDGLGIGLALVKSLVELHGGNIAVYSEGLGKGTEFIVRLPESSLGEFHVNRNR